MRRFTRLTNGFSRKVENLSHAVSLHFMYYNFARPHKTLKERYPHACDGGGGCRSHLVAGRDRGAAGLICLPRASLLPPVNPEVGQYERRAHPGQDPVPGVGNRRERPQT
jgi:hypothetical protein